MRYKVYLFNTGNYKWIPGQWGRYGKGETIISIAYHGSCNSRLDGVCYLILTRVHWWKRLYNWIRRVDDVQK